jgi:hypothetical protein
MVVSSRTVRPTSVRSRSILLLVAALTLPACGGGGEKRALLAYEAAVESLMTEDEGVAARLKDLREDVRSSSASMEDQAVYAREQALPFYRRFREAAGKAPVKEPRLAKIHVRLVEYVDKRVASMDATAAVKKAGESETLKRLAAAQEPMQPISEEVQAWIEKLGGRLPDREAAEAMAITGLFNQNVYAPFTRGQKTAEDVLQALRSEVQPRVARVRERTKEQVGAPGFAGTVARWAKAEDEILRVVAASLPELEAWTEAETLRTKYLEELRAYRESLR